MIKKSPKFSSLMLAICFSLGLFFPATWAAAAMKADINTATIEQLETVNGDGQDTAKNILECKKEHGKFKSMEELEAVNGAYTRPLPSQRHQPPICQHP